MAYDGDSAIYAYVNSKFINTDDNSNPFTRTTVGRFIPRHITPRVTAQSGIFTVHPSPKEPFVGSSVRKLVIKQSFRRDLKAVLYKYGIHRASLFPGLDALAEHIEWLRTDVY
jgi:hypothetical protein